MRILLTGGGTLGSVSPLLAVLPLLKAADHEIQFVGTKTGPEQELIRAADIPFSTIITAKLRRYFSLLNILAPLQLFFAIIQAAFILRRWKPDVIVSAGGFVSVPLVWVGRLMKIPAVIHQQDLEPGLANKLMISSAAKITVAFQDSLKEFPVAKTAWVGNPVRDLKPTTAASFKFSASKPVIFITGGGTGAKAINELVTEKICDFASVIHLTGKGKIAGKIENSDYISKEFLGEEMKEAYAQADLVVARAGLGTISELATLAKPAIIIPMPGTHQEMNTEFLKRHGAAKILDQTQLTKEGFTAELKNLVEDSAALVELSKNISTLAKQDAAELFTKAIYEIGPSK